MTCKCKTLRTLLYEIQKKALASNSDESSEELAVAHAQSRVTVCVSVCHAPALQARMFSNLNKDINLKQMIIKLGFMLEIHSEYSKS